MSTAEWNAYLQRAEREHGDRLDLSEVSEKFRQYFHGRRLRVSFGTDEEPLIKTGTVSVTTGWRPSLMLMLRSSSRGSSWLLSDRHMILAIQHGRTYVPVENLYRDPNKVRK